MDISSRWDIQLGAGALKGRTFLLGNKRAFSLSLPAAAGSSAAGLHGHKWYGAYLYGRKFLEGQVVRVGARGDVLGSRLQTGLTLSLTSARRHYTANGVSCEERYFVPDGVQGFAVTLAGDLHLTVEPEFDIRFARALNTQAGSYQVEPIHNGAVISNCLPSGEYDDLTETFRPHAGGDEGTRLWAAVVVSGDGSGVEFLPEGRRARRAIFRKDAQRSRFLASSTTAEPSDHAPLWNQSSSVLYVPLRFHLHGYGTVLYGFGESREEALAQLAILRDTLLPLEVQKSEVATGIVEHARFETGSAPTDTAQAQVLTRLMDALVARNAVAQDTALDRPATMILAGNQYFHDSWKRDENIAVGALLTLGFYDLARDVIASTWQLQDDYSGRLPQRIRAGEETPYHSSDGTLWALWRLHSYWRCTGDDSLLRDKLPLVERFFLRSLDRTVEGMVPSGRTHAPEYLWETWMDTPHTPRDGFPIEIQMLWIACLRAFRPLLRDTQPELEARLEGAENAAWQALQRFYVGEIVADSLDGDRSPRDLITPNPYFCFGVGLDLGAQIEGSMRTLGRRQLAGKQGIVTLAPQDWERVFGIDFLRNRNAVRGRRMRSVGKYNYHRGVEWNWLAQFFVKAELKYGNPDGAFRTYLRNQVDAALDRAGIGGISELYDLSGTRGPEFQAWSMSGFLEALHSFAGVQIDVPAGRIVVEPQTPAGWPYLSLRKWFGRIPFDLRYEEREGRRSISIDFPWGEPAGTEVELHFLLPRRHAPLDLEVRLDGVPQDPALQLDDLPGSPVQRAIVKVPAWSRIEVSLKIERVAGRVTARSA